MTVTLYTADTSSLRDDVLFNYYYNKMSGYRLEKIDRMRFDEDKRLSLGVGILLEKAARDFGVKDSSVSLMENGKPFFTYSDVKFSLSHSGSRVICAVSQKEIGCDTELISKADYKLAKRFFAPEENEYIHLFADENGQNIAFCRLWTLKESYVKMLGTGFTLPFDKFAVIIDEDGTSVKCEDHPIDCTFIETAEENGYRTSVCVSGKADGIKDIKIDFSEKIL